jgi:uncharacterized protein (UPF0335 family)
MLPPETTTALGNYVERISELHSDRAAVNEQISAVYAEAKESGFDVTVLRQIVKEHKMEGDARQSLYRLLNDYRAALGMFADTPLGEAAIKFVSTGNGKDPKASTTVYEGAAPRRRGRPRKSFAEQPILPPGKRRGPGRPRKNGADAALNQARAHLDGDDLPPAA